MLFSGLKDHWIRKWAPEKKRCDPVDDGVIGLDDTHTVFYLAAIGLALASLLLGIERMVLVRLFRRAKDTVVTTEIGAAEMVTAEIDTAEMVTDEMITDEMVNAKMVTAELFTAEMAIAELVTTEED